MRLNYETVVIGPIHSILVPYRPEHVAKYHEWMQDPNLLTATASEPLSLDEEYEMQNSWKNDDNKCTFIVLSKERVTEIIATSITNNDSNDSISLYNNDNSNIHEFVSALVNCKNDSNHNVTQTSITNNGQQQQRTVPMKFIKDTLPAMIGDVNLFLSDEEQDEEQEQEQEQVVVVVSHAKQSTDKMKETSISYIQAELDIMIAESMYRNKGIGPEIVCLIMLYATYQFHTIRRFFCKIHKTNTASLYMFQTKLNFVQCNYTECFEEYEVEYKLNTPTELQVAVQQLYYKIVQQQQRKQQQQQNIPDNNDLFPLQTFYCPENI